MMMAKTIEEETTTTLFQYPIDIETTILQSKECNTILMEKEKEEEKAKGHSRIKNNLTTTTTTTTREIIDCYTSLIPPYDFDKPFNTLPMKTQKRITNNMNKKNLNNDNNIATSPSSSWCNNIYVGVHHKTGTFLTQNLIYKHWGCFKSEIKYKNHMKPNGYLEGLRIAHFIRDPLEVIISGYQYHLIDNHEDWLFQTGYDSALSAIYHNTHYTDNNNNNKDDYNVNNNKDISHWLNTTGYQAALNNVSLSKGLEMEYNLQTNQNWTGLKRRMPGGGNIWNMINSHLYLTDPTQQQRSKNVFTIRLDSIQNDEMKFLIFADCFKKWFGGDHNNDDDNNNNNSSDSSSSSSTRSNNILECCFVSSSKRKYGSKHISKSNDKVLMRQILMDKYGSEIIEMRQLLGFPLIGLERSSIIMTTTSSSNNKTALLVDYSFLLDDYYDNNIATVIMFCITYLAVVFLVTAFFTFRTKCTSRRQRIKKKK